MIIAGIIAVIMFIICPILLHEFAKVDNNEPNEFIGACIFAALIILIAIGLIL